VSRATEREDPLRFSCFPRLPPRSLPVYTCNLEHPITLTHVGNAFGDYLVIMCEFKLVGPISERQDQIYAWVPLGVSWKRGLQDACKYGPQDWNNFSSRILNVVRVIATSHGCGDVPRSM
jgi:hypothetical protein